MRLPWGGLPLVIRGKKYYPPTLDGIIAENEKGIAGFLYYEMRDEECEIIVFEVFDKFKLWGQVFISHKSKKCQMNT